MLALVAPIVIGLGLSCLTGGELERLRHIHFRGALFASLALLGQVLLFSPVFETRDWAIHYGPHVYLMSMVVVLLVIAANVRWQFTRTQRNALAIAGVGVLLNCIVVAANGAYMPRLASESHPAVPAPAETGRLVNVAPMTDDSRLWWLGDILPEPASWPLSNVLSFGDVLLACGLGGWAIALTRFSERHRSPAHLSLEAADR